MNPAYPGAGPTHATQPQPPLRVAVLGACSAGAAALARTLAHQRPALQIDGVPALPDVVALHACDLIVLLGLDPLASNTPAMAEHEQADQRLRSALQRAGLPYRVAHGSAAEQLNHALNAIDSIASSPGAKGTRALPGSKKMRWNHRGCEKCSDPDCERRLFTGLHN